MAALGYGGAYSWVMDGVDAFRLHVAFAAGFLALAALSFRLWRSTLVAIAAAVLAAAGLGPALVDPISTDRGAGPDILLVYANLYDANPVPEAAVEALLAAGADILVTSETPAVAATRLGAGYPHRVVKDAGTGPLRTAIWSRLPLRNGQLFLNNNLAPTAAAAIVVLDGTELHLTGVHFSRAIEGLRTAQVEGLAAMDEGTGRPRIVIGDFNAAPWSWTLTEAARRTGTQVMGGYRVTWTGEYPAPGGTLPTLWGHGIDHMLHSAEVLVRAVDTLAVPGSDHRALRVRVQLWSE